MNRVLDTSFLVGCVSESVKLLGDIRAGSGDKLVLDTPNGPCANELRAHRAFEFGPGMNSGVVPARHGYVCKPVRRLVTNLIRRKQNTTVISPHDGEPSGKLRAELEAIVREQRLQKWWKEDRMWISLAQKAGTSTIFSGDDSFCPSKRSLESHGIGFEFFRPGSR